MLAAILVFFALPLFHTKAASLGYLVAPYSLAHKIVFWSFGAIFFTLMFLGMSPAEEPFISLSKLFTVLYFVI